MEKTKENFIMLPTVDFCFKELMQNPKVRKGFVAALLRKRPEEIRDTVLMPTVLRKESENDKFGILDVRVLLEGEAQLDLEMQVAYFEYWTKRVLFYLGKMYTDQLQKGDSYDKLDKCIHVSILDFIHFPEDDECYRRIRFQDVKTGKEYTDLMELQILELPKISRRMKREGNITDIGGEEMYGENTIVQWMRFFNGKSREDFEMIAKENEYIDEAYQTLKRLSADEQKRLEYEAREKALKDYNTQMGSAQKRGEELGLKRGEELGLKRGESIGRRVGVELGKQQGLELAKQMFRLQREGKSCEEIAEICELSVAEVKSILLGENS